MVLLPTPDPRAEPLRRGCAGRTRPGRSAVRLALCGLHRPPAALQPSSPTQRSAAALLSGHLLRALHFGKTSPKQNMNLPLALIAPTFEQGKKTPYNINRAILLTAHAVPA